MAKKGEKNHLKSLNTPNLRKVPKKEEEWSIKSSPGPHSSDSSIPLITALRNNLEIVRNKKEAKKAIGDGKVQVDGKVRRDGGYPVGLLDVVEFLDTKKAWRIVPSEKGHFSFVDLNQEESKYKLGKITNKTPHENNKFQISLHDGRTMVGDFKDLEVGGSIKISLPDQEILERIPLCEGQVALITGGTNVGKVGKITKITKIEGSSDDQFFIKKDDKEFQVPGRYLIVIGEDQPEITLPE